MPLLEPGYRIPDSRLTVENYVASGGYAEVYRVKHRIQHIDLAMKLLKKPNMSKVEVAEIVKEPNLLSALNHKNIIRMNDSGDFKIGDDTYYYFTMPYYPQTLIQIIEDYRISDIQEYVEIIKQAARGLAEAHRRTPPVIHRDVKPHNILVSKDESGLNVCLSDFGLAKKLNPGMANASACGTRRYKPREVFLNPNADSSAGDVYGMGVTMYFMFTGKLPYGDDVDDSKFGIDDFFHPLKPPSHLNPNIDPVLESIILDALQLDINKRISSAPGLLERIEAWKPEPGCRGKSLKPAEAEAKEAVSFAKKNGNLDLAIRMLENALETNPGLHEQYGYWLKVWRSGMVM